MTVPQLWAFCSPQVPVNASCHSDADILQSHSGTYSMCCWPSRHAQPPRGCFTVSCSKGSQQKSYVNITIIAYDATGTFYLCIHCPSLFSVSLSYVHIACSAQYLFLQVNVKRQSAQHCRTSSWQRFQRCQPAQQSCQAWGQGHAETRQAGPQRRG